MRHLTALLVGTLALLAGCARWNGDGDPLLRPEARPEPMGMRVLMWNPSVAAGGGVHPAVHVANDISEYRELVAEYGIDTVSDPAQIDWAARRVVVLDWGIKPSSGFVIEPLRAWTEEGITHLLVRTHVPKSTVTATASHPVLAVTLPDDGPILIRVIGERLEEGRWHDFEDAEGPGWKLEVREHAVEPAPEEAIPAPPAEPDAP